MFDIHLLPLAEREIDEAEAWYALKSADLADDFYRDVDEQIERIARNPLLYGVVRHDIRRSPLKPFPHGIFFRVSGNSVFVVGVIHPSRNPSLLRNR